MGRHGLCIKGDVHGPQSDITMVIWQQEYFNRTPQLRVCTQLVHDQVLAADEALQLVGHAVLTLRAVDDPERRPLAVVSISGFVERR